MIDSISRRYEGRWLQGYVRGKLRSDPVYEAVWDLIKGHRLPLLDVGCGIGLLGASLRARGYAGQIVGVDFDGRKIAAAERMAASDPEMSFVHGDATAALPGERGHVLILDVLHYLPADAQRVLLERAAERVGEGGMCVIRECPRDGSWRFRVTRLEEWFIHAISWQKSGAVHFPTTEELAEPFRARGFQMESRPLWRRTPFNSYLFTFRR